MPATGAGLSAEVLLSVLPGLYLGLEQVFSWCKVT